MREASCGAAAFRSWLGAYRARRDPVKQAARAPPHRRSPRAPAESAMPSRSSRRQPHEIFFGGDQHARRASRALRLQPRDFGGGVGVMIAEGAAPRRSARPAREACRRISPAARSRRRRRPRLPSSSWTSTGTSRARNTGPGKVAERGRRRHPPAPRRRRAQGPAPRIRATVPRAECGRCRIRSRASTTTSDKSFAREKF